MKYLILGPIQSIIVIVGLMIWGSLIYVLFTKKDEVNRDLPLILILAIYIFSFTLTGVFVGWYITAKKKTIDGEKHYKFSAKVRMNATIIMAISSMSALLYFFKFFAN